MPNYKNNLSREIRIFIGIKVEYFFIFKRSKIAPLCISIETVEVACFLTGLETLLILGVEMSTGGSTESNVKSFEALLTIYLLIIAQNI
jgi:hypothetical protein